MLIQTSLQISPLNSRGPGREDGGPSGSSTSITRGFIVQAGLCHKVRPEVLILGTWFCRKFSSSSLSSLDPAQPGKKLEFRGERLIGTKTSLVQTEGRLNAPGLQKPSEFRQRSPKHCRTATECRGGQRVRWRKSGSPRALHPRPPTSPHVPRMITSNGLIRKSDICSLR